MGQTKTGKITEQRVRNKLESLGLKCEKPVPDRGVDLEALRQEYEQKPGIYKVLVEAKSGTLQPGDDLLFIVVVGDIRENVKPVLAELLDRIKSEAVSKTEY
jgi:molybdopterin synthase catalytic subunit